VLGIGLAVDAQATTKRTTTLVAVASRADERIGVPRDGMWQERRPAAPGVAEWQL
jgi:hypothetical protein